MATRSRSLACWLTGLLLLATFVGPGPVGSASGQAGETADIPAVDNTVTRIELAPNGSARWTVTIRTRLDSQADVTEYEAFQDRFRANTSRFLDPFEARISTVVSNAAQATGRPMAATAFEAETHIQEVPRRWGIVAYAFTWEGFAAVDGDAVVVGDAFVGGFFLATNDSLVVVPPTDYTVSSVAPSPDQRGERAVGWTGRRDFPDGRPLVRTVPEDAPGAGTGTALAGQTEAIPGPWWLGAGVFGLVAVAGLAVLAARRRSTSTTAGSGTDGALTDEERVLDLLESRDGRVPQSAIGETLGWSSSKTSRLLSKMAQAGTIEKLQLGRENLIQLPDYED